MVLIIVDVQIALDAHPFAVVVKNDIVCVDSIILRGMRSRHRVRAAVQQRRRARMAWPVAFTRLVRPLARSIQRVRPMHVLPGSVVRNMPPTLVALSHLPTIRLGNRERTSHSDVACPQTGHWSRLADKS